jgi:CDGSH-type Zn-finger protein
MTEQNGPIKITDAQELAICTCMQSNHWPLCDGSHHTLSGNLGPELIQLDKTKTYYLCGCYRTKKRPFCDGSHELLA